MWKAASTDVRHDITMVLGEAWRADAGLGIGSPLSAGGSAVLAAWQEELSLRSISPGAKQEIVTRCYIRRWLDGLLVLAAGGLSAEARRYLGLLQSRNFYGTP